MARELSFGLSHARDLQSVAYLVAAPALMAWLWVAGFAVLPYLALLFLMIGIGVIHHNHAHLPMWRSRRLNRASDLAITMLQGHPTCVFQPAHVGNHHRHRHGEHDVARTYRFGGDHNHVLGWLLHPLQAIGAVYPLVFGWLARLRRRSPRAFRWCMLQYVAWAGSWSVLLSLDPLKALAFVIAPQLFGLHWLLGANYLQHAHADGRSRIDYARNFEGVVNPLLFNIGLHTAHHEHPRAHWSLLPTLHLALRDRLDARLIEPSFAAYVLRVFIAGPLFPRWRSRSRMAASASPTASPPSTARTVHADPL
jgi:fatty acid desaturase